MADDRRVGHNGQSTMQDDKATPGTRPRANTVTNGSSNAPKKQEQDKPRTQTWTNGTKSATKKDGPQGGFDNTPIPPLPSGVVGYTLKITLHRATNLAMGDAHVFSSDPYVLAQLNTHLPSRHKEDPKLRFRTPTVRKSTDPEWNEEWIVANVPSSGFKLKLRVIDEDPADHDDVLGKVHVSVPAFGDDWEGIKDEPYTLRLRDSSKRALAIRGVATLFRAVHHLRGEMHVSIEVLGRSEQIGQGSRSFTVGPCRWIRHYSPILGRIARIKEPEHDGEAEETSPVKKGVERYDFQANEMQFPGPVPAELYHRFVEFKPWVKRMFTTSGAQGVVLGKALHHQHTRVYSFGRSTVWGRFPQGACPDMTKQFLDLAHHGTGGRIFTYVLTLDALFRFTETGKEFGIDMLSKHTMHSDVSIYIAFSGEFFIRRLKRRRSQRTQSAASNSPQDHSEDDPPTDPSTYELVIDNDSGTYRPNAAALPTLSAYLATCLPGLQIQTLDCQADAEKMEKMKAEQRERKTEEIIYTQLSDDSSSISSSEDERLEEVQEAYTGAEQPAHKKAETGADGADGTDDARKGKKGHESTFAAVARDVKLQQEARMEKLVRNYGWRTRDGAGSVGPAPGQS